jgi:predicted DNA-binding transcriptional regulator AlpA
MHKDTIHPLAVKLRQAAKMLGISERTLWALAQRGEVPVRIIKNGSKKTYIFSIKELERWAGGERPTESTRGDATADMD